MGHRDLVQQGPSQHLAEEEIANGERQLPLGPAPVGERDELDQLHVEPGRVLVRGRQGRMRRRQTGMADHAVRRGQAGPGGTKPRHHFSREVMHYGTFPDRQQEARRVGGIRASGADEAQRAGGALERCVAARVPDGRDQPGHPAPEIEPPGDLAHLANPVEGKTCRGIVTGVRDVEPPSRNPARFEGPQELVGGDLPEQPRREDMVRRRLELDTGLVAGVPLGGLRAEPGRIEGEQVAVGHPGQQRGVLSDRAVHPNRHAAHQRPVLGRPVLQNRPRGETPVSGQVREAAIGQSGAQAGPPEREVIGDEHRAVPFGLRFLEQRQIQDGRRRRAVIGSIAVDVPLIGDPGGELVSVELLHRVGEVRRPGGEGRLHQAGLGLPVAARRGRQFEPCVGDSGIHRPALGKPERAARRREEPELAFQRRERGEAGPIVPRALPYVLEIDSGATVLQDVPSTALQQPAEFRKRAGALFGSDGGHLDEQGVRQRRAAANQHLRPRRREESRQVGAQAV